MLYRSVQYHTIESASGDDDITPTLNTQVTSSSPPSPSCSYLPPLLPLTVLLSEAATSQCVQLLSKEEHAESTTETAQEKSHG